MRTDSYLNPRKPSNREDDDDGTDEPALAQSAVVRIPLCVAARSIGTAGRRLGVQHSPQLATEGGANSAPDMPSFIGYQDAGCRLQSDSGVMSE